MTNAKIDGNSKPTLIGVSSADSTTPTLVAVNPSTGRVLVDLPGGSTPGGLNAQLQYNNVGAFGGITGATTDGTSVSLNAAHLLNPTINGAGTGLATLAYPNTSTSVTTTVPATTGTLALTSQLTSGTVTSVSVTTANGVSGSVATATTTPAITLTLGAITPTTVNGLTFTGSGSATLALGTKSLTISNTLTLSGTDSTTMTFPTTTATIARTDAAQIFTGIQTILQIVNTPLVASVASNAATITRASRINNFTNSSAATMAITLSTSGALDGDLLLVRIYDFSAVAQTIGWTNTENSTASVPLTSNGSSTLPLTVGFQFNGSTTKWRCMMSI